jgi:hypothetical protein
MAASIDESSPMRQRVLILYTANFARSQMADGLLRLLAGGHLEVFSAGAKPSIPPILPFVIPLRCACSLPQA